MAKTQIVVIVNDTLADRNERIGAIVTAALHAGGHVTVTNVPITPQGLCVLDGQHYAGCGHEGAE